MLGAGAGGRASGGSAGSVSRGGGPNNAGRAGAANVAGSVGAAGHAGGAGGAGGADGAGAPSADLPPVDGATFTDVYTEVISQYCFGSACHHPGMGNRPDFSTQSGTYKFFKGQGQLYGGQAPDRSYIYSIMHGNPSATPPTPPYMPPNPNPKVPPEALAIVAGWIAAGALDN
jgi:hypothetical protein